MRGEGGRGRVELGLGENRLKQRLEQWSNNGLWWRVRGQLWRVKEGDVLGR